MKKLIILSIIALSSTVYAEDNRVLLQGGSRLQNNAFNGTQKDSDVGTALIGISYEHKFKKELVISGTVISNNVLLVGVGMDF